MGNFQGCMQVLHFKSTFIMISCPWQVVYTRGPLLWQGFTAAGNALSKRRLGRSANKVRTRVGFSARSVCTCRVDAALKDGSATDVCNLGTC